MGLFKDLEVLRQKFCLLRGSCVKAVLMFGSRARGESAGRSDLDLLVLYEDCGVEDAVLRRRYFYNLLRELVGGYCEGLSVVDMEFKHFLKPKEITSLLLNIYWDAVVLYDSTGFIEHFLEDVRSRILKAGLKRVKDGKAYYWILPEPLKKVEIL